nr:hypothetical protein [Tanacetum cinerariifolium]
MYYSSFQVKYKNVAPKVTSTLDEKINPNTSIGRLCLGENNQGSLDEGIENKEQLKGPEFQDTTTSGEKKESNVFTIYRIEEKSKCYFTPCYVGGLNAYDGEFNLDHERNLLTNKFAVKLCLEYKEKNREKLVKQELWVSLKGEFYFEKSIINPEDDDVEPSVILGRSFLRLSKGIVDFGNGILTVYPDTTIFYDDSSDNFKNIFANVDATDLPPLEITGMPHFVCNMGKNARIKRKPSKNYKTSYDCEGSSLTVNRVLTREELSREGLKKIYRKG